MTWREELRRVRLADGRVLIGASFRDVPFFVRTSDRTGGRRTVVHQFPYRDEPEIEDLGRRSRVFTVEGYVIGDDYLRARDALLSALEDESGPGKLVHPYHGVRRAICSSLVQRETQTEGGMAVFQLEFIEAPAPSVLPEVPDLVSDVRAGADDALAAAEGELDGSFGVAGLPSFAVESAAAVLASASEELGDALARVASTTQEAARLSAEVRILGAQAASIVRSPTDTMAAFVGAMRSLGDSLADAPMTVLRALLDVYATIQTPAVLGATATRERERANLSALTAALRRALVVEAARTIVLVDYETIEDATADRDAVAELLEAEAAEAGTETYPALVSLRAGVLRAVPGAAVLARQLTVERRQATPSLLLAYQLYGSVELEADVVARNRASHPGFLSGSLKVLSHG